MLARSVALAALLLSLEVQERAPAEPADTRAALERLAHPSADERQAAERWLARHLSAEDLVALGDAAGELGLEARARLSAAIGSDEAHFALAALLAAEADPRLAALGLDALRRLIERWWGDGELPPADLGTVSAALAGHFADRLFALEVGSRSLDEELNTLMRHLGAPEDLPLATPLAVALDPPLYAESLKAVERGAGEDVAQTPEQLLLTLVERHGATLQGFAMDGSRSWLLVVERGRAGAVSGSELIAAWCREVIEGRDDALAEGAARALAATGWPAALDWLAARWTEHGDTRVLAGLLLAAERGRVAPVLTRAGAAERLLAAADEALARGARLDLRFAEEVQRALGRMGARTAGERDLAELAADGFEARSVLSQRLRLGILADLGRVPPELAAGLRARLASPASAEGELGLDGELAIDMLRALAAGAGAGGAEPFVWNDPTPLFQSEARAVLYALHDRWLRLARAAPPPSWRDPAVPLALGGSGTLRRAHLVTWWVAVEPSAEVAADHLNRLAAELADGVAEAHAGDVLARVAARGERAAVERLFSRARERGGDARRLERLELLAGVLAPERTAALQAELLAAGPVGEVDLQLLGVLAADTGLELGAPARAALLAVVDQFTAGPRKDPPWATALERTFRLLRAASVPRGVRTRLEQELLLGLERELGESSHPFTQRLRSGTWPRQPGLEPLPLEALEVRLGP